MGYDVRNIAGYKFMSEEERRFFDAYGYAIEQQADLIAQQHGLESEEHEKELSKLLRELELKLEEYVVEGALLKCSLGTYEKRTLICNDEEIESYPVLAEGSNRLQISDDRPEKINGLIPANIEDCKGGIRHMQAGDVNIFSFGNCNAIPDRADFIEVLGLEGLLDRELEVREALAAGKGTCHCLMNLNNSWKNLPLVGEYLTGGVLRSGGVAKILNSFPYLQFNGKEGINMMSMLFCKCGGGIITAQESGQERLENIIEDDLYIYTGRMIKKIVSIDPKFNELIESIVAVYNQNKQRYIDLSKTVGIPPELIAAIHYRENSLDYFNGTFGVYLHNGDPLGKQLVFSENDKFLSNNFDDAAEDAIRREQYVVNTYNLSPESKDIVALLCFAEKYNGTGYYDNGRISPYIYSGTNVYASGKYVKDHIYDPNVIDGQVGVYLILNALLNEDGSSEENY